MVDVKDLMERMDKNYTAVILVLYWLGVMASFGKYLLLAKSKIFHVYWLVDFVCLSVGSPK